MADQTKQNQGFSLQATLKFFRDVRAELNRITWPSAVDTRRMTLMVFILASLVALYLLSVDMLIGLGLKTLLGL